MARKERISQGGSVMMEAVITLPIYLILFAIVLAIGRSMAQIVWLSSNAYQGAYIGAETSTSLRNERVEQFGNFINNLQGSVLRGDTVGVMRLQNTTVTQNKTAKVRFDGVLNLDFVSGIKNSLNLQSLPLGYEVSAPLLINETLSPLIDQFENPTTLQGCCHETGSGNPTACVSCTSDSTCSLSPVCN